METWITSPIERLAKQFASADQDAPKAFVADCLCEISSIKPRAKESITGDNRRRVLEYRRDEVLKELDV